MMRRKIAVGLLIATAFGILLYVAVYFIASGGEAFKFAEQEILSSEALKSRIGIVNSVRLAPFGPYDEQTAGEEGSANMDVKAVGSMQTVTLNLDMKKVSGAWSIVKVQIDGEPFLLR
jgi:hypothetical protein